MISQRSLLAFLVVGLAVLALGAGSRLSETARALPPAQGAAPEGVTIPYPGRLAGEVGQPVADGIYGFTFALYGTDAGGEPLWSEVQEAVAVEEGAFVASLGSVRPIPASLLDGSERWLAVEVRGPGEGEFTTLSPRQRLSASAPAAPASPTNGGACPHDHFGEDWRGTGVGLTVMSEDHIGLLGLGSQGTVLFPAPLGHIGVYGRGDGTGVYGESADTGVYGDGATGVRGTSSAGHGVEGTSDSGIGVFGISDPTMYVPPTGRYGVYGMGEMGGVVGEGKYTGVRGIGYGVDGTGVHGKSSLSHGVYGETSGQYGYISGVYGKATKVGANGVTGWNEGGGVGVFAYSKSGEALIAQSETGNLIEAWDTLPSPSDQRFRVENDGDVFADRAYHDWGTDYADMVAVTGDTTQYEPGDVLAIGPEGLLVLADTPHTTKVAGVYSTQPGFLGGDDGEGSAEGKIPLALVGVVPVKASAENGPIAPGDLLVASGTPGHAMKAGDNPPIGSVIGKAFEGLDEGTGVISLLVMLQ